MTGAFKSGYPYSIDSIGFDARVRVCAYVHVLIALILISLMPVANLQAQTAEPTRVKSSRSETSQVQRAGSSILNMVSNALPSTQADSQIGTSPQNFETRNAAVQSGTSTADKPDSGSLAAETLQRQKLQFELEKRRQQAAQQPVAQRSSARGSVARQSTDQLPVAVQSVAQQPAHQVKLRPTHANANPQAMPTVRDQNVVRAAYTEAVKPPVNSAQLPLRGQPIDFDVDDSAALPSPFTGKPDPINLGETLTRIGTATAMVLVGCCALLIIGKKLGFGQGGQDASDSSIASLAGLKPNTGGKQATISVLETRKLFGRCQLKLIAVDDCRFLVAMDAGGVKSMQAVTPSFPTGLAGLIPDDVEANEDEQIPQQTHLRNDEKSPAARATDEELGRRLTSLIERL